METVTKVPIMEINGTLRPESYEALPVKSHHSSSRLVVLELEGWTEITVDADELVRAIRNATR